MIIGDLGPRPKDPSDDDDDDDDVDLNTWGQERD